MSNDTAPFPQTAVERSLLDEIATLKGQLEKSESARCGAEDRWRASLRRLAIYEYDGGKRMAFSSEEEWIERLNSLQTKEGGEA